MVRAARLHRHDEPLAVEDVELPEPGPDEARVQLAYAGVNPVDRYVAQGRVAPDGPLPRTLGAEASGHLDGKPVVVAASALGSQRDGVWAAAAVVPRSTVVPIPDGVSLTEAAGAGIAGLTAYNVVRRGEVTASDRVLVLGASGGVGLSVVRYAAAQGAQVWGQTGSEAKAAAVREHGADRVIVADADGLAGAVGDTAPTVVIDALGDGFAAAALPLLAPRGRYVLYGVSAGAEATLNFQIVYRNALRIIGYGGLRLTEQERRADLAGALAAMAAGELTVTVDRVVPLAEVNHAFELLANRAVTGKVLLDLR